MLQGIYHGLFFCLELSSAARHLTFRCGTRCTSFLIQHPTDTQHLASGTAFGGHKTIAESLPLTHSCSSVKVLAHFSTERPRRCLCSTRYGTGTGCKALFAPLGPRISPWTPIRSLDSYDLSGIVHSFATGQNCWRVVQAFVALHVDALLVSISRSPA